MVNGGPMTSPNVYLSDSINSLQIRSDTPSTIIPHPHQKAMSPASPYMVTHHSDVNGHHGDAAAQHHFYSDNNNENDYPMHNYYVGGGGQMSHPAMQQSMQGYYPSCPNSPESMANKTLTELNSLTPYSCDHHDQVEIRYRNGPKISSEVQANASCNALNIVKSNARLSIICATNGAKNLMKTVALTFFIISTRYSLDKVSNSSRNGFFREEQLGFS